MRQFYIGQLVTVWRDGEPIRVSRVARVTSLRVTLEEGTVWTTSGIEWGRSRSWRYDEIRELAEGEQEAVNLKGLQRKCWAELRGFDVWSASEEKLRAVMAALSEG